MEKINLLCAKNLISRKTAEQELSFLMLVENLAFDKQVDVAWAGEDGVWHTLAASYHGRVDQDREYWFARITFALAADASLPGNVEFALRYRVLGTEYWDNHHGKNHAIQADSGIIKIVANLIKVMCVQLSMRPRPQRAERFAGMHHQIGFQGQSRIWIGKALCDFLHDWPELTIEVCLCELGFIETVMEYAVQCLSLKSF